MAGSRKKTEHPLSGERDSITLRQQGEVLRKTRVGAVIEWEDREQEEVHSEELARFSSGQRVEVLLKRDQTTWRIRSVLDVQPLEPLPIMTEKEADALWSSLQTTKNLPKATYE